MSASLRLVLIVLLTAILGYASVAAAAHGASNGVRQDTSVATEQVRPDCGDACVHGAPICVDMCAATFAGLPSAATEDGFGRLKAPHEPWPIVPMTGLVSSPLLLPPIAS